MATSGPGAVHLLNGLYDAQARPPAGGGDRRPAGAHRRWAPTTSRRSTCRRSSRTSRASSCRCAWSRPRPPMLIDRAMRIARGHPLGRPAIIVPNDVQEAEYSEPPRAHGAVFSSRRLPAAAHRVPRAAARSTRPPTILNAGEQVAMLIGQGAHRRGRRGRADRRAARRGRGQGAQRQGGAARRPALRDRLDRPAGDQAVLRHDGRLRHAADGRARASPTRSGCPSPGRRAACRSTSTGA